MARLTDEERAKRENEKNEKRIKRELDYINGHFFVTETTTDENGKTVVTRYPVTGNYVSDGVSFNWDSNNYIVLVDSHVEMKREVEKNGKTKSVVVGHEPMVKQYTRCKETSKNYYFKGKLLSCAKKTNEKIVDSVVTDMTIEEIIAKAPNAKGFRPATNARLIDCFETAKATSATIQAKRIKAEERAKAKAENVESVA